VNESGENIPRVLEPELMDDAAEAEAYDAMDHRQVNEAFVNDLLAAGLPGEKVVDLGTGTARIPIILCQADPSVRVLAIDAAIHMLERAIVNIDIAGLRDRIQLASADVKSLADFEDGTCDCVISNTLLHHLPDPGAALSEACRIVRPGGRIFIRDLMRPASARQVDRLVALHAGSEPPDSQQLLRQSLHAALTLAEIKQLVQRFGLPDDCVAATSDRHWTLSATRDAGADA
jgi:ubiquinone/menaquinone biosynthesis C-methylase UbiE